MPTCYRHAGRETGVSCSNCARPICADCMTPTPVGMRCPECSKQRTKVRTISSVGGGEPRLTYAIIALCVVAFLAGGDFGVNGVAQQSWIDRNWELTRTGIADGQLWRLVTSGFLHAGIIHIAFNMYLLYLVGPMIEQRLGRVGFGAVYLVAILGGALGALVQTSNPFQAAVGASGAIFGLMGFVVVTLRNDRQNPVLQQIGLLVVLNLVISVVLSANISLGGHLGGLVAGGLAALVYEASERRRMPRWAAPAACVAIAVVAAVASVAVAGDPTSGIPVGV